MRSSARLALGAWGRSIARDTKLNRDVALKILPESFTADPDRLARFRREAQVLASLNHPNIAAIYGFEDSGATHALVMEFVDGLTLAELIDATGDHAPGLSLADALPIARQIAEALEAAHETGIIVGGAGFGPYAIHPDGKHLALAAAEPTAPGAIQDKVVFVSNFFDYLRKIAPSKK